MSTDSFFLLNMNGSVSIYQNGMADGPCVIDDLVALVGGSQRYTRHFYKLCEPQDDVTHVVLLQAADGASAPLPLYFGRDMIDHDYMIVLFAQESNEYRYIHCAECAMELFNFIQSQQENWCAQGDKIPVHSYQ